LHNFIDVVPVDCTCRRNSLC